MAVQTSTQGVSRTAWQIDAAHTTVEFGVKHMMFTTAKGHFPGVSGSIVLDEQNPAVSSVDVEIDARTIDTREEKRDAHLRSADFFDVEKYPSIRFKSTRVEPTGERTARVQGDLTIRDVTKPATLDVELLGQGKNPWGAEVVGFQAATKFNRSEFGLNWNAALETGGFLVSDEVKVEVHLEAIKTA